MRKMIMVMVILALVSGCCSYKGWIKADTVESNFEAVAVPYLRYIDADKDLDDESKQYRVRQIEEFRELIKISKEGKVDGKEDAVEAKEGND